ncbi:MAG: penicillin-binding protein [Oscillospiraceae bacterium]|jgi:peptidoglycan glycosyltransferase|nr:penicillin-binding protein [Oscillospiraceae bacterium]
MNKLAKRAWFAMVLAGALLLGMAVVIVRYMVSAPDWVTFQSSPHVYSNGVMNSGVITDRSGTVVLNATSGRSYAESESVRKAMLHLLGDREGNITPFLLNEYGAELVGFDRLNGTYSTTDESAVMKLTISADVQKAAYAALDGRKGTVGVYNYKTGEILCAVSSPSFDPDNVPDIAGNPDTYDGAYYSRFLYAKYAPGSVFKVLTAAAALEEIDDISARTFTCTGSIEIAGETLVCNGVHGTVTFEQALAQSCNCAFAEIAGELGANTLTKYARRSGVAEQLHFDGVNTAAGSFDLSKAGKYETAWAAIGQYNDQINPCSYMVFMGAIANGGKAAEPYFVEKITRGNSSKYEASTEMTGRMIEKDTAAALAEMMHYAVENVYGTWNFAGLDACAKSGTAEVGEGKQPNAVFTGFVRNSQYPLAFIVVVENGGSGSAVCTPIISRVLSTCIVAMDSD